MRFQLFCARLGLAALIAALLTAAVAVGAVRLGALPFSSGLTIMTGAAALGLIALLLALIWLALRTVVGQSNPASDFAVLASCQTLRLSAARQMLQIAIDGEVHQMAPPLEFTIQPRSLNLVVEQNEPRPVQPA